MSPSMCASPRIALRHRTRRAAPVPDACSGFHGNTPVPGSNQRPHPGTRPSPIPTIHLGIGVLARKAPTSSCSRAIPARPRHPLPRQHPPAHRITSMSLMISAQSSPANNRTATPRQQIARNKPAASRRPSAPNKNSAHPHPGGTTSPAAINSPGNRKGHDLAAGASQPKGPQCSPSGGCHNPESAPPDRPIALIRDPTTALEEPSAIRVVGRERKSGAGWCLVRGGWRSLWPAGSARRSVDSGRRAGPAGSGARAGR